MGGSRPQMACLHSHLRVSMRTWQRPVSPALVAGRRNDKVVKALGLSGTRIGSDACDARPYTARHSPGGRTHATNSAAPDSTTPREICAVSTAISHPHPLFRNGEIELQSASLSARTPRENARGGSRSCCPWMRALSYGTRRSQGAREHYRKRDGKDAHSIARPWGQER